MNVRAHNLDLVKQTVYYSGKVEINPNRPDHIIVKSGSSGSKHTIGA